LIEELEVQRRCLTRSQREEDFQLLKMSVSVSSLVTPSATLMFFLSLLAKTNARGKPLDGIRKPN